MGAESCPVFRRPKKYLKRRKSTVLFFPKAFSENAAMRRCLRGLGEIASVVDVPCGPGRLFPFWKGVGVTVHAADLSEQMVAAARETMSTLGINGTANVWDVFAGAAPIPEPVDMAVCVRFAYYFTREKRMSLLQILAGMSKRYVLVQYKTRETLRGRMSLRRRSAKCSANAKYAPKSFCSNAEMLDEIREAGLVPLRIALIGEFSDRVFVLAEKAGHCPPNSCPDAVVERTFRQRFWHGLTGR